MSHDKSDVGTFNSLLLSIAGSSLSDAVIRPEDYSIHRQLSPRLSLYARLVTENVSVYVFSHALVNSHHHNSIGTTRTGSCSKA